jgi:hypothetical protein
VIGLRMSGPRSSVLSLPKAGQPGAGEDLRRISGEVEHRVERVEPPVERVVTADQRYKEITCAGGRDISRAHGLRLFPAQLVRSGLEKLDRRQAADRLEPQPADRIDMTARCVAGEGAGGIREHDDRKLQALRLVHGHQSHTLGALLDDWRFVDLAALGIDLELVDKGPERRRAALELPRHFNEPLDIGERLLAGRPERDPGMRTDAVEQPGDRLRDRAAVAPDMQFPQQVEGVGNLGRRGRDRGSIDQPHRVQAALSRRTVRHGVLAEKEQRLVAQREKRPAQGCEDAEFVVGPFDRGERGAQGEDLFAVVK